MTVVRCALRIGVAVSIDIPDIPCGPVTPALRSDAARATRSPCHICTRTGLTAATSAPGLGSPLPHLHRDRGSPLPHLHGDRPHRSATSAPGPASPLPYLHRDWGSPLPHLHRDWGALTHPLCRNDNAVRAAVAEQPREGTKNFTLFELQCYSHHKAGFGGYRPRNAINDPGDVKETELTANGTKDAQMLRSLPGMPAVTRAHGIPAAMMHDFFQVCCRVARRTARVGNFGRRCGCACSRLRWVCGLQDGQITKSENGKFNAQTYFGKTRPLEGIPKVHYASKTTDGGAKFVN